MFSPISEQEKLVISKFMLWTLQLSVLPLSISVVVIVAFPFASSWTVIFCVTTVGLILSSTVTVAVPVFEFPLASVTVNVTVFAPRFEHEKLVTSKFMLWIPVLSELPLLISVVVIVAFPFASNWTVVFCVTTVGFVRSIVTDKADEATLVFPAASVALAVIE